jgi:hypothetical protein
MRSTRCGAVLIVQLILLAVTGFGASAQTIENRAQAQILFDQRKYSEALASQRGVVSAIEKAEVAAIGKASTNTADALNRLSWYALFARSYPEALTASTRAA